MPLMSAFRSEFGFRIKKKRRVRDVYRITGADGKDYCYKPFSFPEEEVAFLARINLFLTGKGYRYTPRLAAPEGDKLWTCHRGKYWLLTNWVKGSIRITIIPPTSAKACGRWPSFTTKPRAMMSKGHQATGSATTSCSGCLPNTVRK
ncbi:hypothetical protein N6H14_19025 [Paenibacillus sp. CC-CFT747]|nr:hypothetical protein N6H14_19025 [Paenibacillus sp. CC-CFT747]